MTEIRKRSVSKIFVFLFVILLPILLAGCNTDSANDSQQDTPENNLEDKTLILATTTSVNDTGLMEYLEPLFEEYSGIDLQVLSQGTGQAIQTAEDGNADVLLIHAKAAEEEFISEGYGLERIELMYNYFVIVGPKDDPAKVTGIEDVTAAKAFEKIQDAQAVFVSRGDDSGTHKKELSIWESTEIEPSGDWYVSAGKGMGDVLTMASEKQGYTLTDKATFLSMKDKLDLDIVVDASEDLLNQYTIIEVDPEKLPDTNKAGADIFVEWITSDDVLQQINDYGKDEFGENLFTENYGSK
ncbi:MAG: substrate-binding domain-containing protein [Eubacteriales bacterium]